MNVLDLFSGIGGFSLGLERAGMRTVAFCEINQYCRAVLAKHWPGIKCYEDVRELTAERLALDIWERIDVICGGFPCQDISDAGLREGIQGARSGLWKEYSRLIGELRPRFVIVENVAALLGRGLGIVLGDLAEIGYDAEWHCIPACAIGADHIRDRIWIIAYSNSAGSKQTNVRRRKQRQAKVGKDASNDHGTRSSRRVQAGAIEKDGRAISARLGFALSTANAFPGLDGAGSPVLGRGENGIPNRVDRMHSIGNAVVPQIPEIIGRAIMRTALTEIDAQEK